MSKEIVNNQNLIVKKNSLIDGKYVLSVYELRIFSYLLSKIGKDDQDFEEYVLSYSEIIRKCNLDKRRTYADSGKIIKSTIKKLQSRVVEISDGGNDEWETYSLFHTAKKERGKNEVRLQIAPGLKPFLLDVKKNFSKLELPRILSLKSIYSIRIYEISLRELRGQRSCTYERTMEKLRFIFDLEKKYARFDSFRRVILEAAKTEISSKTNITIDYTLIKSARDRRKVEAIRFSVVRKDTFTEEKQEIQSLPPKSSKTQEPGDQELPIFESEKQEFFDTIVQYGVAEQKAKELIANYSLNQIAEALEVVECDLGNENKKIRDRAGYVIKSIENGFKIASSVKQERIIHTLRECQRKLEDLNNEKDKLTKQLNKEVYSELKSLFLSQDDEVIDEYLEATKEEHTEKYRRAVMLQKKIQNLSNRELVESTPMAMFELVKIAVDSFLAKEELDSDALYQEHTNNKKILQLEKIITELKSKADSLSIQKAELS